MGKTTEVGKITLGKLKTIFWAFNIVDFAPFNEAAVTLPDGSTVKAVGTWFNHHLDLPTGESLDAGVASLRSWWDIAEGTGYRRTPCGK